MQDAFVAVDAVSLPLADGLGFRSETEADLPFLQRLYASTRAAELRQAPWSEADKQAFLVQQFAMQRRYYREHFPDAAFDLVLHRGQPIGRRYIARAPDLLTIIDLALLPDWCGQGRGSSMLAALQREAAAKGIPIRLHVEYDSPAVRLYTRLGFVEIARNGVHSKQQWTPLALSSVPESP
jgi:GNAT superfamily N-acetyltransferase